jgi:choline-sulfatase
MREITRRTFGRGLAVAAAAAHAAPQSGRRSRPPNLFFISSDSHNGRITSWNGHPLVRTPNLDRLAASGVTFTNTYCCGPVCVPSRASLMTGMFPSDVGSCCNSTPFDGHTLTWANRLRDNGYFCWATGKLDLTAGKDYGFQESRTDHLHSSVPDITSLFRRPLCYRVDKRHQIRGEFRHRTRGDDQVVRHALDFFRREIGGIRNPWALYVGLVLPHPPFVAHARYRDLIADRDIPLPHVPPGYLEQMHLAFRLMRNFYLLPDSIPEKDLRSARAAYFALLKELDDYLGQLVDEVNARTPAEDTVIVCTSDHGEMLGEHGLWFKNVLLEDSARVPLILSGGGLPRGKKIDVPVSHADLAATLLDFAGIDPPKGMRGRSLLPLIHGNTQDHPGFAYSESHSEGNCTGFFMIRRGLWKYIYFSWQDPLLFHLGEDPGELRNLAGKPEHSSIQQELHGMLTGLVNPDEVTERAFQAQENLLAKMSAGKSPEEMYELVVSRLGKGQARALALKHGRN